VQDLDRVIGPADAEHLGPLVQPPSPLDHRASQRREEEHSVDEALAVEGDSCLHRVGGDGAFKARRVRANRVVRHVTAEGRDGVEVLDKPLTAAWVVEEYPVRARIQGGRIDTSGGEQPPGASGGRPGHDGSTFEHSHLDAVLLQEPRGGQTHDPRADDGDMTRLHADAVGRTSG
jgi:hypothetical protein